MRIIIIIIIMILLLLIITLLTLIILVKIISAEVVRHDVARWPRTPLKQPLGSASERAKWVRGSLTILYYAVILMF